MAKQYDTNARCSTNDLVFCSRDGAVISCLPTKYRDKLSGQNRVQEEANRNAQ